MKEEAANSYETLVLIKQTLWPHMLHERNLKFYCFNEVLCCSVHYLNQFMTLNQ